MGLGLLLGLNLAAALLCVISMVGQLINKELNIWFWGMMVLVITNCLCFGVNFVRIIQG